MLIICSGFGAIAIVGYLSPVVELSKLDGRCRIGLPPRVSFPLLCFDVFVNLSLTGLFFWLLRPVLNFHGLLNASSWFGDKSSLKVKNVRKRSRACKCAARSESQVCGEQKHEDFTLEVSDWEHTCHAAYSRKHDTVLHDEEQRVELDWSDSVHA